MHLHAEPPPGSQRSAKFSGHKCYESEDIDFSNFPVILCWSRDQRLM